MLWHNVPRRGVFIHLHLAYLTDKDPVRPIRINKSIQPFDSGLARCPLISWTEFDMSHVLHVVKLVASKRANSLCLVLYPYLVLSPKSSLSVLKQPCQAEVSSQSEFAFRFTESRSFCRFSVSWHASFGFQMEDALTQMRPCEHCDPGE